MGGFPLSRRRRASRQGHCGQSRGDALTAERTTSIDALADCDLVIEAIVENLEEKRATYAALERVSRAATILALQHVVALHHGAGGVDRPAGSLWPACISSIRCR